MTTSPRRSDDPRPAGAASADSNPPVRAVGLAVIAAAIVAFGLLSSNLIDDDAFIFFRYADNIVDGHGPTWNPGGEMVEGYSSFLWLMLLLAPLAAGVDPVVASHVLNGVLLVATVIAASWAARGVDGGWSLGTVAAPWLVAMSAAMATWARMGMEIMLFSALLATALALTLHRRDGRRRALITGCVHGLVILTRPEGTLFSAICLLWMVVENRRRGRPLVGRDEALWLFGAALLVVPHLAWRVMTYDSWLPNTFYAKVGFRDGLLARGLEGLLGYLDSIRGALTAAALAIWAIRRDRRSVRLILWLLGAWLAYLVAVLGLPSWDLWYTMPVDLFTLLLLAIAAGRFLEGSRTAATPTVSRRWTAAAILVVVATNAAPAISHGTGSSKGLRLSVIDPPTDTRVHQFTTIGRVLGRILPPDATLAVGACGAIPFYSGLVTYDVLGLNDRHIARTETTGPVTGAFGHDKGDGVYILSRRPTVMIPLPVLTTRPVRGHAGFEKSFIEIYQLPGFQRSYEYRNLRIPDGPYAGRYLNYWIRTKP